MFTLLVFPVFKFKYKLLSISIMGSFRERQTSNSDIARIEIWCKGHVTTEPLALLRIFADVLTSGKQQPNVNLPACLFF